MMIIINTLLPSHNVSILVGLLHKPEGDPLGLKHGLKIINSLSPAGVIVSLSILCLSIRLCLIKLRQ